MKSISSEFQDHLNGETITLCNCWQIDRPDGSSLGFTDHDLPIEFDGLSFEAASGFQASQMEASSGLTPDNHQIMGALQSERISSEDIRNRLYDGASVAHFIVNWMAPEERSLMHKYLLGEITQQDGVFKAELKSLTALLDQTNVRRFERRCNASLGDEKCGIDLNGSFITSGIVEKAPELDLIYTSGLESYPEGWFAGGKISFVSGTNQGLDLEIVNSARQFGNNQHTVLSLWSAPPKPVSAGDHFQARPGCDKLLETCRGKFSNALNFQGFPHMPGSDFAMSYANNSDNMDGGPLVP